MEQKAVVASILDATLVVIALALIQGKPRRLISHCIIAFIILLTKSCYNFLNIVVVIVLASQLKFYFSNSC